MNDNTPFFSIIVPTFNRAALIGRTIQSALTQTFKSFELIIVDDGSTDNTQELIQQIKDDRLIYYKKENGERGAARNFGVRHSTGKYVYFLDSDDLLYENHLQTAFDFIQENTPDVFFQQYEFILKTGEKRNNFRPEEETVNDLLVKKGNFMSCHGVFLQKDVIQENLFREDRTLAGSEDYELWLRIAARYPILYSDTISSALVEHEDRSVLNFKPETLIVRKERMLDYIFSDKPFMKKYGRYKNRLISDAYSYISLHLQMMNHSSLAIKYWLKAFRYWLPFLGTRRCWAILKRLI